MKSFHSSWLQQLFCLAGLLPGGAVQGLGIVHIPIYFVHLYAGIRKFLSHIPQLFVQQVDPFLVDFNLLLSFADGLHLVVDEGGFLRFGRTGREIIHSDLYVSYNFLVFLFGARLFEPPVKLSINRHGLICTKVGTCCWCRLRAHRELWSC